MPNFLFAQTILKKRQQLHMTQEEIANYIGVTRAAVSKWEKGLSYPDISLLPKLATLFDTSIDELLGYEPQLTTEKIEYYYMLYAKRFGEEPFELVMNDLNELTKEYYACYPFLLKVVQLYINYIQKASEHSQVWETAFQLINRIKENGISLSIIQEATAMEALLYIMQKKPEEALQVVGEEPEIDYGITQLLITAYAMMGNTEKAKEIAQVGMFQNALNLISTSTESLLLDTGNEAYFEETIYRIESLMELYKIDHIQINVVFVFYLKAAIGYMQNAKFEKALIMLKKYAQFASRLKFPLRLNGDAYFYMMEDWMKKNNQLMRQAPRDEQSIKKDIVRSVLENPIFMPLHTDPMYKSIEHLLNQLLSKED